MFIQWFLNLLLGFNGGWAGCSVWLLECVNKAGLIFLSLFWDNRPLASNVGLQKGVLLCKHGGLFLCTVQTPVAPPPCDEVSCFLSVSKASWLNRPHRCQSDSIAPSFFIFFCYHYLFSFSPVNPYFCLLLFHFPPLLFSPSPHLHIFAVVYKVHPQHHPIQRPIKCLSYDVQWTRTHLRTHTRTHIQFIHTHPHTGCVLMLAENITQFLKLKLDSNLKTGT